MLIEPQISVVKNAKEAISMIIASSPNKKLHYYTPYNNVYILTSVAGDMDVNDFKDDESIRVVYSLYSIPDCSIVYISLSDSHLTMDIIKELYMKECKVYLILKQS